MAGLYFDKYTVTEWIEQHIQPLSRKMGKDRLWADFENMLDYYKHQTFKVIILSSQ